MTRKIGYLGPKGSFTSIALEKYKEENPTPIKELSFTSIQSEFDGLSNGLCDAILVPVENSLEGTVNTAWDTLVHLENTYIEQELLLPIEQALLTLEGVAQSDITDIISHAQPLAQCQAFIHRIFPNATLHRVPSSSIAAEMVIKNQLEFQDNRDHHIAVIGHRNLAKLYDLSILEESIQDIGENITRFFLISTQPQSETGSDKTSLVFTTKKDQPGSLLAILKIFSNQSINLTQIMSRPIKQGLGDYRFFIDCNGHQNNRILAKALNEVSNTAQFYKCLGSYPKGTY